jgi:hypothetical protein
LRAQSHIGGNGSARTSGIGRCRMTCPNCSGGRVIASNIALKKRMYTATSSTMPRSSHFM